MKKLLLALPISLLVGCSSTPQYKDGDTLVTVDQNYFIGHWECVPHLFSIDDPDDRISDIKIHREYDSDSNYTMELSFKAESPGLDAPIEATIKQTGHWKYNVEKGRLTEYPSQVDVFANREKYEKEIEKQRLFFGSRARITIEPDSKSSMVMNLYGNKKMLCIKPEEEQNI
ncbi:hypothetical protein TUMSATVNIG1_55040 [Vibrio nigripulchritudo]|uniref:hypothetical protein n=1 Tax=Vibrio nigripulchritudo TaxID=28173 RepID=UPI00190D59A9|nr:hypothetical protein [Vibrio nigripulchritudo]BCL73528.1 hypothetical protein VNTUMSATTG_54650 [Vibrio nigripulchritudo]BDU34895.1 hypothetical protein TUMSATVNIG1_55040 [Vibrio nigripulchritudo]